MRHAWVISIGATLVALSALGACTAGAKRAATSTGSKKSPPTEVPPAKSTVTPSTVPGFPREMPTGAVEIIPTPADLTAIGNAYVDFTGFSHCGVEPVPGQMKAAVIKATGVKWAFGSIQPVPGCTVVVGGKPTSPDVLAPFSDADYRRAVFTDQPGGVWRLNWFESDPFPCPADLRLRYQTPGPGTPYVPLAVLNAVGVPWSSSPKCDTPLEYIPDALGGH
jgi:hypothetical protein